MIGLRLNPLGDHAVNIVTTPMYEPLGIDIPVHEPTVIVFPDGRRYLISVEIPLADEAFHPKEEA